MLIDKQIRWCRVFDTCIILSLDIDGVPFFTRVPCCRRHAKHLKQS